MKIVECVPNFSEGRRPEVVEAIAAAMRDTPGVSLLDVDPGKSTNRTVFTFVGSPEAVVNGAFNAAIRARDLIDMRTQKGEHPRMGAMDVCPFIPVANVTMDECVKCAQNLGKRLGDAGIPVYLYEEAAASPQRQSLRDIRAGEYEGFAEKIKRPEWRPDFGPAELPLAWGASVVGARNFLIAYNVNILGTKEQAHRIALNIREQGRSDGKPGRLRECRAIGWFVEEYGLAQVSINLTDFKVTPIHVAFEECVKDATDLKLAVAGSEIVGLVPRAALLMAADYYIKKEDLFIVEERHKIRLAAERLGLSSVKPFVPEKCVIDYMIAKPPTPLTSLSVSSFVDAIMSRDPTPGGGSAAALIASVGAALAGMVGYNTQGKRKWESKEMIMRELIPHFYEAVRQLVPLVDADAASYEEVVQAAKMPKGPERETAIEHATKHAIEVPLNTMRLVDKCWAPLATMAMHGNIATKSDLQVGSRSLELGLWAAHCNVLINLSSLHDEEFRKKVIEEANQLKIRAAEQCSHVLALLDSRTE